MKNISRMQKWREAQYLLFLIPALTVYIIFFLYPVLSTIGLSMTDARITGGDYQFVGLQNFRELFTGVSRFPTALKNNLLFTFLVTIMQSSIAFFLALVLDAPLRGKGAFKTYFFTPVVITAVAVSLIWDFMYDPSTGVMNTLLEGVGLGFLKKNWLGDKSIAMFSLSLVQVWQWVGYEMMIFIAGLNAIPREMYEVSKIEGANYFQTLRYVIIPCSRTAIVMAIVLTTTGCFKVFDLVYIMTGGGPVFSTEVLAKMVYDYAFRYGQMGFASSISVVLMCIIMLIGFGQLVLTREKD